MQKDTLCYSNYDNTYVYGMWLCGKEHEVKQEVITDSDFIPEEGLAY